MLGGDSSLLCDCHNTVGVDALRSTAKQQCEVGGTAVLPLGKEPLCIHPQGLSARDMMPPTTSCEHEPHPVLLEPPRTQQHRRSADNSLRSGLLPVCACSQSPLLPKLSPPWEC